MISEPNLEAECSKVYLAQGFSGLKIGFHRASLGFTGGARRAPIIDLIRYRLCRKGLAHSIFYLTMPPGWFRGLGFRISGMALADNPAP